LTIKFPEGIIVRLYGSNPNDRLEQGGYGYIPNVFENIVYKVKQKYLQKQVAKYTPEVLGILEKKKENKESLEINELYKQFPKMKIAILDMILFNIKHIDKRDDLFNLVTIKQLTPDNIIF